MNNKKCAVLLKNNDYQEGKFSVGTILACICPILDESINMNYIFNYLDRFKEDFFAILFNLL